jgi:hypothetical protein
VGVSGRLRVDQMGSATVSAHDLWRLKKGAAAKRAESTEAT